MVILNHKCNEDEIDTKCGHCFYWTYMPGESRFRTKGKCRHVNIDRVTNQDNYCAECIIMVNKSDEK